MKKIIIPIVGLVLVLASCTSKSFKLTGEVNDGSQFVYYVYDFFDEAAEMDSVPVVDGKFVIEGENAEQAVFLTGTSDQNMRFWAITEPGEIKISDDGRSTGTPLNDAISNFYESAQQATDESALIDSVKVFMGSHNNDLAGAFVLYMFQDLLGAAGLDEQLGKCGDVVKNTIYRVVSAEDIEAAKQTEANEAKAQEATAEGQMFVDFEAEYEGKVQHLSDFVGKGKYVLVDFWASWCGPCRAEIPNIIQLYDKYAGSKFEVLGVATWDDPEETKKAIEELGIKYPQMMNAQKAGSDAYGISGIPQIILFGPDGTILKRNLRGEEIGKAVEEALNSSI